MRLESVKSRETKQQKPKVPYRNPNFAHRTIQAVDIAYFNPSAGWYAAKAGELMLSVIKEQALFNNYQKEEKMAKKTSGHIRPCNVGSVEAHNERSQDYIDNVKRSGKEIYFFPELSNRNSTWINPEYGGKSCSQIFDEMKNLYRTKKGQAPQLKEKERRNPKTGRTQKIAGWSPLREMVAVIKEDTKVEDFNYFKKWAENQGLQVVRIDIHKDEGHTDTAGIFVGNFHAHVILDFLDKNTADTVKLGKEKMRELQTVLAISLGMERGEKVEDTDRVHMHHDEFRKMMREIDAMNVKLSELQAEEKKAQTRVKGLTSMVANLEKKQEELLKDIKHLQFDQNAMEDINENLYELNKANEKKNNEIAEKKKQLTIELADIQAKFEQKNGLLKKARQQLQEIADSRATLEKEYNSLHPKYKKLQEQYNATVKQQQEKFSESVKEQNQFLQERQKAIEKMDKDGLVEAYKSKADVYEQYIFERWPSARPAVNAIYDRTTNRLAHSFTFPQAASIDNALASATSQEERKEYANDLVELAHADLQNVMIPQKWIEQAATEVLQIAEGTHVFSEAIVNARSQADSTGGPSYINDLTDWSGRKKH